MKEESVTLKTISQSLTPISRRNKKVEIEKRNLAASIVIKASEKLAKTDSQSRDLIKMKAAVANKIKNGEFELEVYLDIYNARIKALSRKVDMIEEEKAKNDGFLKEGKKTMLKQYVEALEKIKKEKEDLIKNYNNDKSVPTISEDVVDGDGNEENIPTTPEDIVDGEIKKGEWHER